MLLSHTELKINENHQCSSLMNAINSSFTFVYCFLKQVEEVTLVLILHGLCFHVYKSTECANKCVFSIVQLGCLQTK